jgi:hypothetical protein
MRTILAATLATTLACGIASADMMPDHGHDFDFIIGKWTVHHHRLKARLMDSHEWEDFAGTSQVWKTLNGHGTFDENFVDIPSGGYWADGIRAYDPKTQLWAIWWLDARNPHDLEAPVKGNFQNGIGTFEADDTLRGKPIKVRFTWSGITANTAHWEQAFSPDGGKSWETNWVMDLTRAP